jgi:hypothetical protein
MRWMHLMTGQEPPPAPFTPQCLISRQCSATKRRLAIPSIPSLARAILTMCTSLVHSAGQRRRRLGRSWLRLGRSRGCHRLGLRFPRYWCSARDWAGQDNRAGYMVVGFPAVLPVAGDHKDLVAGAGLAKPGDIRGGDVALAVGRGPQQSQVILMIFLIPAGRVAWQQAPRGLAG